MLNKLRKPLSSILSKQCNKSLVAKYSIDNNKKYRRDLWAFDIMDDKFDIFNKNYIFYNNLVGITNLVVEDNNVKNIIAEFNENIYTESNMLELKCKMIQIKPMVGFLSNITGVWKINMHINDVAIHHPNNNGHVDKDKYDIYEKKIMFEDFKKFNINNLFEQCVFYNSDNKFIFEFNNLESIFKDKIIDFLTDKSNFKALELENITIRISNKKTIDSSEKYNIIVVEIEMAMVRKFYIVNISAIPLLYPEGDYY